MDLLVENITVNAIVILEVTEVLASLCKASFDSLAFVPYVFSVLRCLRNKLQVEFKLPGGIDSNVAKRYKASDNLNYGNTQQAMASRQPSAFKDCRYCGKTFSARGVTSHETRYCSQRPLTTSTPGQIDTQATIDGACKPHRIIYVINDRLTVHSNEI